MMTAQIDHLRWHQDDLTMTTFVLSVICPFIQYNLNLFVSVRRDVVLFLQFNPGFLLIL